MKNKVLWIGSVIILILSIICFVVFGVGTELIRAVSGDGSGISFGKYDGKEIVLAPGTDFANAVQSYTNYYQNQGAPLDQSAYFYIYNYAFNAAVQATAYREAVRKSGYKPSGTEISRAMLPYFLNADGKYDPILYNEVSNADKESLRSGITRQLIWQRFSDDTFGAADKLGGYTFYGIKSGAGEAEFLASLNDEKRSIEVASFDKADYPDSEVRSFGAENISLFDTLPLSMITVREEAQARKLLAQLNGGEITFEDAVSEYSEKYYSDGDGKVSENFAYQIKENLADEEDFQKIAALAADSLSDVIKTNTGYSIYKATGEKAVASIDDDAVLDAVRNYVRSNRRGMIDEYFTAKAKSLAESAGPDGFDKAAKDAGAEVVTIPAFPLNYGDVSMLDKIDSADAKALLSAGTNEDFLTKVFSMKQGDISEPMTLGNYIAVFKLAGIQNDSHDSERLAKVTEDASSYDEDSAQSALLSSKKVENNVADVYFNKLMSR